MTKHGAPLRSGIELYKAATVTVLGVFMLAAPNIGTFEPGPGGASTANLLAWAWSWPLGIVLLACGLIGIYAMYTTSGKPDRDAGPVAA